MTSSKPSSGDRPSSAEDAYAQFLKLRESGSAPDFETWVRAYPQFERELRALEHSWDSIQASLERVLASTVIVPPEPLLPSLAPGLAVGEFTLVRRIGVGGMGVVWLARQAALEREVALKFVRPDRETAQSARLFAREARAAARARDPRIATVYAVGESGGHRWLAQEYVPGSRGVVHWLRELQDRGLPPDHDRRVAAFVAEVAEALHAAHLLGVVHRDVKPQNLLIAPDGSPRITDFGLARLLDEVPLSESLNIRGTVEYSSPEQVTGANQQIDARSDVFSLGVVLYELLTLQRPFTGMTLLEVIAAITVREARPPSSLRRGLASELDVIALKALEKQPEARYASALEFAQDLRRWLAHEPIAARPPGLWQRCVKWMRRHPTATSSAIGAALLLGLAGAGALVVSDSNRKRLESEKDGLRTRMNFAINEGRMDEATRHALAFSELDPADPEPRLTLAMGFARYLRLEEAKRELSMAQALGYVPYEGEAPGATDLYLRGLYLIAAYGDDRLNEVEDLMTRALAADPELGHAWFPIYLTRKQAGDVAGAREALQHFRKTLRLGDVLVALTDAMLLELDGDHLGTIAALETLRAQVDEARAADLRLDRHLGRNLLNAYMQDANRPVDLLDRAEAALTRAVTSQPQDGAALAHLGMAAMRRANRTWAPDEKVRLWAVARECAERATALEYGYLTGNELLVLIEFDALQATSHADPELEQRVTALERQLERLLELDSHNPNIPEVSALLDYHRGAILSRRGDAAGAVDLWRRAVETHPRQLYARVLLGEKLYFAGQFVEAQMLFQEALDIWDESGGGIPGCELGRGRKWLFASAIWLFGSADKAGDTELARRARDRALSELERDDGEAFPQEMLSLAEFLALPDNEALKDCPRALELLERYDLVEYWQDRAAGREIVDSIHSACP